MIWTFAVVASAVLAIAMLSTGAARRWPSIFTYLALIIVQWATTYRLLGTSAYFYSYWAFSYALYACEVWVIVQLAVRIFGVTAWLRSKIRHGLPTLALVLLCITLFVALTDRATYMQGIVYLASRVDVAISLAWFATFLLIIFGVKAFGLQLSGGARGVAIGFWIEAAGTSVIALLLPAGTSNVWLGAVKSVLYMATLSAWTVALLPCKLRIPCWYLQLGHTFSFDRTQTITERITGE